MLLITSFEVDKLIAPSYARPPLDSARLGLQFEKPLLLFPQDRSASARSKRLRCSLPTGAVSSFRGSAQSTAFAPATRPARSGLAWHSSASRYLPTDRLRLYSPSWHPVRIEESSC